MDTTKWYLSKTLWVNVVSAVAALAGVFNFDLGLTPEVQATVVTTVLALANVLLRLTTKTPISK